MGVISTGPRKGNLVARLRGTGANKPMLLLAHIDVVPAGRRLATYEPFKLTEADGYFHGRGVIDDKAMAAMFVANLIEFHRERLQAGARHHRGAHHRRGARAFAAQRHALAAGATSAR